MKMETRSDSNSVLNAIREGVTRGAPRNWTVTTLGDCFKWGSGGTPSRTEPSYFGGDIPWVVIGDLNDDVVLDTQLKITESGLANSSAKWVEAGSVLVAMYGSIGKLGIAGRRLATNQAIAFTNPEPVNAKFLYYYLRWQRPALARLGKGATQLNISQTVLKEFPFLLAPADEQENVVAEVEKQFSRLDEAVANLKRVKANLKRYKASVLKDAVEGRLVPTEAELALREGRSFETGKQLLQRILEMRRNEWKGKGKYKEPSGLSAAHLAEVPEGWAATTAGQLCDCIVPSRDKPKSFSGTTPWLTLPDFEEDEIVISGSRVGLGLSESEIAESKAKVVPQGSVVMSCVGRFGITAVLGADAVINQQLHAFLPNAMVMPKYLAYALRTRVKEMTAASTATTIAYLNKENCNNVQIACPPLPEQIRIVAEVDRRLSFVFEVEEQVDSNLKRAHALRRATLSAMFSRTQQH